MSSTIFDRATASCGGRFDTSTLVKESAGFAEWVSIFRARAMEVCQSVANDLRMPPIHFDFINDSAVNAFATRFENEYCIGVNIGTLDLFLRFFLRILAAPEVLRHIGRPELEQTGLPKFTFAEADALAMARVNGPFIVPVDEGRHMYAVLLADRAFLFLLGHELRHIINGHVDFLEAKGEGLLLSEFVPLTARSRSRLIRQHLELNADDGAISGTLALILRALPADPTQRTQFAGSSFFSWSFATYALFRLFGDQPFNWASVLDSYYPPVRYRQLFALVRAHYFLEEYEPALRTVWGVEGPRATAMVEDALAIITGKDRDVSVALSWEDDAADDYYSNWLDSWHTFLRADLLPFAHAPLASTWPDPA